MSHLCAPAQAVQATRFTVTAGSLPLTLSCCPWSSQPGPLPRLTASCTSSVYGQDKVHSHHSRNIVPGVPRPANPKPTSWTSHSLGLLVFHPGSCFGLGASLLSPALLGTAPPPDPSVSQNPAFLLLMGTRGPVCQGTCGRKGKEPSAEPGPGLRSFWPQAPLT